MTASDSPPAALTQPIALWVIPVPEIGGVARHTLDVTRAGIPGWRIVVFCPDGALAEALRAQGRPVLTGDFGPAAGLRRSVQTLRRTVARLRPTIVHTHLSYADIAAAIALRALPAPRGAHPLLVSTEHGIAPGDLYQTSRAKGTLMSTVHRVRCHAFDALIAVCESTRDLMRSKWHVESEITVILNGVDRPEEPHRRQPGLRVASLARLSHEKRIDRLLAAFARVLGERPEARLTIAGSGPLEADLQAEARRLGLADAVAFPGHVDASALLATTDVVVQLSAWENCSYTLLDACAAGVGAVATPVGGNVEILPSSALSSPDDLDALTRIIIGQGERPSARPGLPARWPTVDAMAQRVAAVYEGLVP